VHYKPQIGQFLVTEKSASYTRRSDSECQQTASSPTIILIDRLTSTILTSLRLQAKWYSNSFRRYKL